MQDAMTQIILAALDVNATIIIVEIVLRNTRGNITTSSWSHESNASSIFISRQYIPLRKRIIRSVLRSLFAENNETSNNLKKNPLIRYYNTALLTSRYSLSVDGFSRVNV
jgi:hypothetical protein